MINNWVGRIGRRSGGELDDLNGNRGTVGASKRI